MSDRMHHLLRNARQDAATQIDITYVAETDSLLNKDNGTAISKRNQDRIAVPFFTTKRDAGGTGMGLAIVAAVLKQINARIEAEPSEDGALFRIEFTADYEIR
ncbi:ATP-binding protein [uncultured Ruegeria sp.]|uniref:ATP-binding protein n=1 Tax=uncultured Ruegeria sp. TaxID=259304 RepID=UPI00261B99EF|nr:ATP-binding protein [uncultured Ruegeria sp.]